MAQHDSYCAHLHRAGGTSTLMQFDMLYWCWPTSNVVMVVNMVKDAAAWVNPAVPSKALGVYVCVPTTRLLNYSQTINSELKWAYTAWRVPRVVSHHSLVRSILSSPHARMPRNTCCPPRCVIHHAELYNLLLGENMFNVLATFACANVLLLASIVLFICARSVPLHQLMSLFTLYAYIIMINDLSTCILPTFTPLTLSFPLSLFINYISVFAFD